MLRIHASFHKCLTMYYIKVMHPLLNWLPYHTGFKHFESIEGEFYNTVHKYRVASTSGFAVDTTQLSDEYRIVRFVRDPRDLVVSGYFYHKRGAEPWFRYKNPTQRYWQPINGQVPSGMPRDFSYSEYLNTLSLEDGLLAELEFRKNHLESIRHWDQQDERIKLFRYEDILGNEKSIFEQIFEFYHLSFLEKKLGLYLVNRYAHSNQNKNKHIRDPQPGQWKDVFTPGVTKVFNQQYSDILELLKY